MPDDSGVIEEEADAGVADVAPDVDKSAPCASMFGNVLTNAFGRVDGTIVAIVPPTNTTCALPNSTHLVLQVKMNGAVYRMVVNVYGAGPDPRLFLTELDAPLAGGAWAEGWHPGVKFDYVTTLGVHAPQFMPMDQAPLVAHVTSELELGARVSVFATSSGGATADSAHLVHRNTTDADGAIVITPDTAPHFMLFRFPDQNF